MVQNYSSSSIRSRVFLLTSGQSSVKWRFTADPLTWFRNSQTGPRTKEDINSCIEYENHEEEWTEPERVQLLSLWEQTLNLVDITEKLQRPKHQIILTLFELDCFDLNDGHVKMVKNHHLLKE